MTDSEKSERIKSGIRARQSCGLYFGRPRKIDDNMVKRALELRRIGTTYAEIAAILDIGATSVHNIVRGIQWKKKLAM